MGVFGFLRKGKKAEAGKGKAPDSPAPPDAGGEAADVRLDDVLKAVEGHIAGRLNEEVRKAEKLYREVSSGLTDARKHASELEKKKFEASDKTYAVVNMTKDNFVKKANSLISGLPRINNFDYEETSAFCSGTRKILGELLNIQPKQAILLTRYFKKESSKVITALKETDAASKEMETLIANSMLGFYSSANKKLVDIWQLVYKAEDLENNMQTINEKIGAKKLELREKEKEREAFIAGEESTQFTRQGEELKRLEAERTELGNVISDRLSAIKRPLKKLEHAVASGSEAAKDKERLSLYSRISHSPMKVLMEEQGDALLMEALGRLRDIGLKDEERERVEELIKKIELGYISGLTDKYKWLEGEIAERKKEFEKSGVPEKHKKHEREIEHLKREIAELEKETEKIMKSREELAEKTGSEKVKLEEIILKEADLRLNILLGDHAGRQVDGNE
jgi:hypothetical protein